MVKERKQGEFPRLTPVSRTGDERFCFGGRVLPFDVLDFWRWSVSDLVSNATRGRLAEYIVARACRVDTTTPRDEWAPVDLRTPEGFLVEVKSAAYVQSWHQTQLSRISFRVPKTCPWDPTTNRFGDKRERLADVYVFALLAHKDKSTIAPLDLDQWEFYVLSTCVLNERKRSQHSITLPSLKRLGAGPCTYDELRSRVDMAARLHRRP